MNDFENALEQQEIRQATTAPLFFFVCLFALQMFRFRMLFKANSYLIIHTRDNCMTTNKRRFSHFNYALCKIGFGIA